MDLAERAAQLDEKARHLFEEADKVAPDTDEVSKAERNRQANEELDDDLKDALETLRRVGGGGQP